MGSGDKRLRSSRDSARRCVRGQRQNGRDGCRRHASSAASLTPDAEDRSLKTASGGASDPIGALGVQAEALSATRRLTR